MLQLDVQQGHCRYEWNPMGNVWDGNLWQQAIFPKKKQTFHPINGLVGWMYLPYTDVILKTVYTGYHYELRDRERVGQRLLQYFARVPRLVFSQSLLHVSSTL